MNNKPRALKKFCRFFNSENFFEAHEVLEALWLETEGEPRDFYQGLIQIAAAFVHLQKGTPDGAKQLLRKASQHLKEYPNVYLGIDSKKLLTELEARLLKKTPFPKVYLTKK